MGRTPTIDTQTILDAAREVFLEEGVTGTTAEIARRAGVSEGSIFRRFPNKEELFFESMDLPTPSFFSNLDSRIGRSTVAEELDGFMHDALDHFANAIPCIMMVMASGGGHKLTASPHSPPVIAIRTVANYLAAEVVLGRLRPHDPEIAARMLLGSAWHFMFAEISGINTISPMPRHTFVRGVVDNVIHGLSPLDE